MDKSIQKTILVTGASSGIGNAVAGYLARKNYTVLAAVRKESNVEKITEAGLPGLIPLYPLDLTLEEQIHTASKSIADKIKKGELPPLHAVINIAGGGQIAPIELMNVTGFREELEKRLVGPVVLLQQLLPLLRKTRGRILWIATPGLIPVPYVADIHATDFAVNYLARTLNLELQPDGIKNVLIRCGGIETTSLRRTADQLITMMNE